MKLIIDIDEETYNRAKNEQSIICGMNDGLIYKSNMKEAIANGTPYEERPKGDLISREALKEDLKQYFSDGVLDSVSAKIAFNMILRKIDNAPTVFSCNACKNMGNERECVDCHDYSNYVHYEERPQGEWKYTTHHARRYRICPFCKCEKEDDRSAGWFYCWHCGADMKGGTE